MSTEAFAYVNPWVRRMLYLLVFVLVALVMFPFLWLLLLSFKENDAISQTRTAGVKWESSNSWYQ